MTALRVRVGCLQDWLILHEACPCGIARRLHLPAPARRLAARLCGRIDAWGLY